MLRHLANTLKSALRGNEPLYRFGGEEFLWLMQCKSVGEADLSAQRLLNIVRTTPFTLANGKALPMTVTLGLALVSEHEELCSALKRADEALYAGKNAGRDCFVIANP